MLHKTRGIVINNIKYGETSIIAKIYTESFGLQTYIENGVRGTKAKNKIALFQPLNILDLIVYYKETGGIQRIAEVQPTIILCSIPYDFKKTGIGLFIAEILYKTLKEESSNLEMFGFLISSIQWLDTIQENFENFHLQFLLKLARYLGFDPQSAHELLEQIGRITSSSGTGTDALDFLIKNNYSDNIKITGALRRDILEKILQFYNFQIENFGEIKSLAVLREILS